MSPVPDSWRLLRNMRNGNTCVIVGNGPSLADVPISFLNKYDTFSANRLFPEYLPGFRHKWYVSVNPLVIEQSIDRICKLDAAAKFIAERFVNRVPGSFPLHSYNIKRFSTEPWSGVYEGYTVTFVSMQLAYALGYRTLLLVGVDHRFQYDGQPNEEKVMQGADPNHFHPDYFKGMRWNNPDLKQSENSYRLARNFFEGHGGRIVNLGPDSDLDVFERGELSEWIV